MIKRSLNNTDLVGFFGVVNHNYPLFYGNAFKGKSYQIRIDFREKTILKIISRSALDL